MSDLGILMRRKQDLGDPRIQSRDIFLGERQNRAEAPENQGDDEWTDEESAAQSVNG